MFGSRRSLRSKILRLALVPTVIMLLAATAVTYVAYQRTSQQVMRDRYGALASLAASTLSDSLRSYSDILWQLAQDEAIRSTSLGQQRLALERWGNRLYPFDAGVAIINRDGIISWSQPLRFDWIGRDMATTPYFEMSKEGEVFSDLITAETFMGGDVILIGVPFLDVDGEFAGMLAGVFRMNYPQLSPIYAEILKIGLSQRSYAYLVDHSGRIVYHPDAARVGDDVSTVPAVGWALRGESGASVVAHPASDDLIIGYAPVATTGWALVVQENWEQAMLPVRRFAGFLLAALLVGLLVPMVLVRISVERLVGPFAALAQGAERIASGDFEHTVSVSSGDELQTLAYQFNVMARRLRASYANLELKVDERTKELATLNQIAVRVSQSLDIDAILGGVLDELDKTVNVHAGGLYLPDPIDEQVLLLSTQRGLDPEVVDLVGRMSMGSLLPGRVFKTRQPLSVADVSSDSRTALSPFREIGAVSVACVPVQARGQVLGTLFVVGQAYREFTPEELDLLIAIGHQVGIGLENAQLFADLGRRNVELSTLNAVAAIVNRSLLLDSILADALSKALELMRADVGEVRLLDTRTGRLHIRAQLGGARDGESQASIGLEGELGEVIRSGEVLLLGQPGDLPGTWDDDAAVESVAILPLHAKGRIMGTMSIGRRRGPGFTNQDTELLLAIGNQLGIAVDNARLYERERTRANQLRIINQIGQHITAILSINELLPFVARTLQETFSYHNVSISMLEEASQELVLRACAGECSDRMVLGFRQSIKEGSAGLAARGEEPVLVRDFGQEPPYRSYADLMGQHAGCILPVRAGGRTLGTLEVQGANSTPFEQTEISHLRTLADQIAIAIENARLYEESRDLATVEERTRLARELHDSVTQSLFSIVLNAEAAGALIANDPERASQQIQRLQEIAQDALAEMRSLIYELRPPSLGTEDLESALQRYIAVVERRYGLDISLRVTGERRVAREYEQCLYRIAQEALMNVIKHAQAERVEVDLAVGDRVVSLTVMDDGIGMAGGSSERGDKGFGLTSMRDRAELLGGIFEVTSEPGHGTRVVVRIPLRGEPAD